MTGGFETNTDTSPPSRRPGAFGFFGSWDGGEEDCAALAAED